MSTNEPTRFSREFKLEALRRMEAGENVSVLARELGVSIAGQKIRVVPDFLRMYCDRKPDAKSLASVFKTDSLRALGYY